jgi:C4-type Zn-finger protein
VKNPSGEQIECPSCGSTDLRWSHKPHFMNFLMAFLFRDPIRCNDCSYRFYERALSDVEYEKETQKKQKGRKPESDSEDDED